MYYYAEINSDYLVVATHSLSEQSTNSNYISITEDQYTTGNLIGRYYNKKFNVFELCNDYIGQSYLVTNKDTFMPLSTLIDNMQVDIDGKASSNHTHSGYALANHSHTEYASTTHAHSYDELSDKPTIPEAYTHPATHPATMITGLPTSLPANGGNADTVDGKHAADFATADHNHGTEYATVSDLETVETAVNGKASANHTHSQYAATGHTHENDYAGISHTHAQSDITGLATALSGKAAASHTHSQYAGTGHNHDTSYSGINHNHDTNYADISHTHTLDDVTETTNKKVMTSAERTKLSGIATGANKYTHPTYTAKSSGLYKVTVDSLGHVSSATAVTKADITGLGIPSTNTTYSNATTNAAGLMSATDKSKLDGIESGANKTTVDSALSSTSTNPVQNKAVNSALAGKAATNHNHDTAYISKDLQMTSDTGDVVVNWTGQDVVAKIKALQAGMCTAYAKSGTTNSPKTTESWRFLVHKTSVNFGWVQAFGSFGSMYIGYVDNGTWEGWKCVYDASPDVLWFGNYWVTDTQTVTPSKALSKCKNGWVLVWSDYDTANEKSTNGDFYTTIIPKKNGANNNWSGQSFIAIVPHNMTSSADSITCKRLYVHDTKITGHAANSTSPRNDVVLRAIYEF